jgi:hypothetical protein
MLGSSLSLSHLQEEEIRMATIRLTALVLSIAFLVGCSASPIVMLSEYKGQTLSAKQLAVAPFSPTILNKDDVVDDLGAGVADDVFMEYFHGAFPSYIKKHARVAAVIFLGDTRDDTLTTRELSISDEERIKVRLPPDGSVLGTDSSKPEFVLFFNQYAISRIGATSGTWVYGPPGTAPTYSGGSFGKLHHQAEFALWDNTRGRLVSYGRAEIESSMIFGMAKRNWDGCLNLLAREIMKASPLYEVKKAR